MVAVTEVDHHTSIPTSTSQLDPSSEAEALSHVASGIAASLGLPVGSPSNVNSELSENMTNNESGPLSDLEHFDDSFVRENRGVKRTRGDVSVNTPSPNVVSSPPKKVSKLALEWTEDEEETV